GPNGAGKSTLVNVATGFAACSGSVLLDGRAVDGFAPHRRATLGLRRSFQQLRVPPGLSSGKFLSLAAGRRLTAGETSDFLAWFGCPPADTAIGTMDVGARRMLEVAGLTAGQPSVLMLDEPAAGQGARETALLSERITQIPALTGSTVVLIEHDVEMVRNCCQIASVMDFGRLIASGEPDQVLNDPEVVRAYVGSKKS
ncbi:MAG: ATP-binding cassette domain-containing protein, partial [Acidimicrobiales bacterium]